MIDFFDSANEVILKIVDIMMLYAPYGVFGLMASLVTESPSADIFMALGKYALVLTCGLLTMIILYYIIVYFVLRKTPKFFL